MTHLFVLFPLLVILIIVAIRLYRKHPEETSFYYFRNFFVIWSLCTLAIGVAETTIGTPYAKSMALSFAVPFLYVASAYLIRLPFAMYGRGSTISVILMVFVITAGGLFGATTFVGANKLITTLGPLQGLFEHLSANLTQYRIWSTLAIFVPIGLFFYYEAARSQVFHNRLRSIFVGSGFIVAGVSEYFHIIEKHAAGADIYTVLGFFLVTFGLFYPLWKPQVTATSSQNYPLGK